ncbi:MAG: CpsD/CapB family tyrosine-protein kinase [Bacilli bacterium]|nr:CpsD/CapB family tyrosine-protein kinase [Bacilli bacterium]
MKKNKNKFKNEVILNNNPKSAFSESIRSIRANLQFSDLDNNKKVILMTSANPHEGKSFVTANLACSFAKEGKKVLIIDADLRKGRQHRIFRIKNNRSLGYSNMILKSKRKNFIIDPYINKTFFENLDIINIGKTPPSPTELLSSENNKKLLELLKEKYDYIFLDCPPVIGLSDALILSQLSDYNVIVAIAKQTKQEHLLEVKKAFEIAKTKITGVILNKVERKKHSYYYYGYYGD